MNETDNDNGAERERAILKELTEFRFLRREIRMDSERLIRLGMTSYRSFVRMSERKRRETAARDCVIADIRRVIAEKLDICLRKRLKLERYIASVDDSLIRMAMTLRFLEGLTWRAVALRIGGNTEESIKKQVYRYISSHTMRSDGLT